MSGLILFVFAGTHFLNHAMGLISLDAMVAFDQGRNAVTRSPGGTIVLVAALLAHAGLGVWQVARKRSWVMPVSDWLQIVLGLAIPLLLLRHIMKTRFAAAVFDAQTTFPYELAHIWTATIIAQSVLLLLVWVHGCIGMHFWLRVWRPYRPLQPVLLALAVLVPFAALAGVSVQGRAIAALVADPAQAAALHASTHWPDEASAATLERWSDQAERSYAVGVGIVLLGVVFGAVVVARRKRIAVRYADGPVVWSEPGPTILDVSRRNGIAHVAVCGGRGRCSTCRVLVIEGGPALPPPGSDERRTLDAIGAGPHVRLACQTVPRSAVSILPLVKAMPAANPGAPEAAAGTERDLAVLFVDLRGFTALTERKLPFDVIYILNQFFAMVGTPIAAAGGWIANYAGDGVIALFGDDKGMDAACRSALFAAASIDQAMDGLNERLMAETRQTLRIAMGLHAGPHVMGRVGFGASQPMSVVGLAVNVASRLEALAKQEDVQLALSGVVADRAGLDIAGLRVAPIDVRGLSEPLDVVFMARAADLLPRLAGAPAVTLDRLVLP